MKCENCNIQHDGTYSSRFCSEKCSRSFSTKRIEKTKIIYCVDCNKELIVPKRSRAINVKCKDCIIEMKECKWCKKNFSTNKKQQICCSMSCSSSYRNSERNKNRNSEYWSIYQKKLYQEGKQKVGGGTTKWYSYKDIKVQGSYELRTCYVLDKMKSLNLIKDWEYTNDRCSYIDVNGSKRTYLLDFKVYNHNSSFYYIETKGYSTETDECKWKSAIDQGLKLEIWFNEQITLKEKELNMG